MQLRQLEIFLCVAKNSSFSKAAEELYLAQPTVSAHVRSLEEELSAKLFKRSTRGLSLTPQGQLLFSYASQIVNFCDRARTELTAMTNEQQNRLTVAASTVPAQYLLPSILPEIRKLIPKTCFNILQGDSEFAVNAVLMGDAEIGIVGSREDRPDLKYYPLVQERLVAAAPNTPYFRAMKGGLSAEVLQNFPFIMRERGSGTRKAMEQYLRSMGVTVERMNIAAELSGTEAVMRCIQSGLGISIVSGLAAEFFTATGDIILFDMNSPLTVRQFYVVVRDDVPLSAAAKCLMEQFTKLNKKT